MNTDRLKEFSGDRSGIDVVHWLRTVEMYGTALSWTEEQQLCYAAAALTGTACYWLDSVTLTNWLDFKTQLVARFGENPDSLAQKLYSCKQGRRETTAIHRPLPTNSSKVGSHRQPFNQRTIAQFLHF